MKLTLLVATILLLSFNVYARNVTITCQAESSCSSGYTYKYESSEVGTATQCADPACSDGMDVTFNLIDCEKDYTNATCSTGRCFIADQFSACYEQTSCSSTSSNQVTCDADTCGYTKYILEVADCSKDDYGTSCGCCMTVKFEGLTYDTGICTSTAGWDSDELEQFAWGAKQLTRLTLFAITLIYLGLSKL